MLYSEYPHEHYINNGVGPGAIFLGNTEMWNWRYVCAGTVIDPFVDQAIATYFNSALRDVMRMPPAEALEYLTQVMAIALTEDQIQRLEEAQDRLYPPIVASVRGNVVHANFGAKR